MNNETLLKARPNLFECRVYETGWVFRVGRLLVRKHSDDNYSSLSFDWAKPAFRLVGGESLKKFLAQRRAEKP
jgi:hypothetical protein